MKSYWSIAIENTTNAEGNIREKLEKNQQDSLKKRAKEFGETVAQTLNSISNLIVEAQAKTLRLPHHWLKNK